MKKRTKNLLDALLAQAEVAKALRRATVREERVRSSILLACRFEGKNAADREREAVMVLTMSRRYLKAKGKLDHLEYQADRAKATVEVNRALVALDKAELYAQGGGPR